MESINPISLLLLVALLNVTTILAQDGVCGDCNCQLSNVQALGQFIQDIAANYSQASTGVTYVRWGRTVCPNTPGTELVYSGKAVGTFFSTQGGGAEKLCLPDNPDYLNGTENIEAAFPSSPHVHGAEYEFSAGPLSNLYQHNVPCVVCLASTRSSMMMVPVKSQCPPTWTREYYGYLTAERATHRRSKYSCVDVSSEAIGGTVANTNGALFYHVITNCGADGVPCPPFVDGSALSCAVCTK